MSGLDMARKEKGTLFHRDSWKGPSHSMSNVARHAELHEKRCLAVGLLIEDPFPKRLGLRTSVEVVDAVKYCAVGSGTQWITSMWFAEHCKEKASGSPHGSVLPNRLSNGALDFLQNGFYRNPCHAGCEGNWGDHLGRDEMFLHLKGSWQPTDELAIDQRSIYLALGVASVVFLCSLKIGSKDLNNLHHLHGRDGRIHKRQPQ